MSKIRKRLFMFSVFSSGECGIVRAYSIEEAADMVLAFYDYQEAFEMRTVPREFKVHVPIFHGRGR